MWRIFPSARYHRTKTLKSPTWTQLCRPRHQLSMTSVISSWALKKDRSAKISHKWKAVRVQEWTWSAAWPPKKDLWQVRRKEVGKMNHWQPAKRSLSGAKTSFRMRLTWYELNQSDPSPSQPRSQRLSCSDLTIGEPRSWRNAKMPWRCKLERALFREARRSQTLLAGSTHGQLRGPRASLRAMLPACLTSFVTQVCLSQMLKGRRCIPGLQ